MIYQAFKKKQLHKMGLIWFTDRSMDVFQSGVDSSVPVLQVPPVCGINHQC